jgi:hypothetical protein
MATWGIVALFGLLGAAGGAFRLLRRQRRRHPRIMVVQLEALRDRAAPPAANDRSPLPDVAS